MSSSTRGTRRRRHRRSSTRTSSSELRPRDLQVAAARSPSVPAPPGGCPVSANLATITGTGLTTGCILALIGAGFALVCRATGVVSFAQGRFMVLGALIFGTISHDGGDLAVGLVVVCAPMPVIGALIYWLVFSRLVGAETFVTSVATVGLGILVEAVALLIWW